MYDKVVITIARQYGSGGRTVGEMLSKDMGIHYYDKELIKLASEESGINERLFVNEKQTEGKSLPDLPKCCDTRPVILKL